MGLCAALAVFLSHPRIHHPIPDCFCALINPQKSAFRVSQKHPPFPNLCHTGCVTATKMQWLKGTTGLRAIGLHVLGSRDLWSRRLVVSSSVVSWSVLRPLVRVPRFSFAWFAWFAVQKFVFATPRFGFVQSVSAFCFPGFSFSTFPLFIKNAHHRTTRNHTGKHTNQIWGGRPCGPGVSPAPCPLNLCSFESLLFKIRAHPCPSAPVSKSDANPATPFSILRLSASGLCSVWLSFPAFLILPF